MLSMTGDIFWAIFFLFGKASPKIPSQMTSSKIGILISEARPTCC